MARKTSNRVIIVTSETRMEKLVARFNTKAQAKFYLKQSQANLTETMEAPVEAFEAEEFDRYEEEYDSYQSALQSISQQLSRKIKFKTIHRSYLTSYMFSEEDIIVVVGQDGLVANTAKYVNGLPIIGVNPSPSRYDGVLLPFQVNNFFEGVESVMMQRINDVYVSMAEARLNDGQRLLAFNDLFIGPKSHTSARYSLTFKGKLERQSSSGVIVSTGAGSTGWLSSLFNMANGISTVFGDQHAADAFQLPWNTEELPFIVREPFQSRTSEVSLSAGLISEQEPLIIESMMPNNGVIFSDGIEADYIPFNSGSVATISLAPEKARMVLPQTFALL